MTAKLKKYNLQKKWDFYELKKEGAKRISKRFDWTKKESIKLTADFLNKVGGSVKIHKSTWWYQEERTYPRGMDPIKSKG